MTHKSFCSISSLHHETRLKCQVSRIPSAATLIAMMTDTPPTSAPSSALKRPSSTRTSFPQFSRLPYELRLLVWLATFTPRVVYLDIETEGPRSEPLRRISIHLRQFQSISLRPRSTNPAALAVCRESRALALEHYAPYFRDHKTGRFAYFRPTTDTLFLKTDDPLRATYIFQFVDNAKRPEIESVRYLAVEARTLEKYKGWNLTARIALSEFTQCSSLAVLTIVGQWEGVWQQTPGQSRKDILIVEDFDNGLNKELTRLEAACVGWRKPQVRKLLAATDEDALLAHSYPEPPGSTWDSNQHPMNFI